jgi:hypothetical protein
MSDGPAQIHTDSATDPGILVAANNGSGSGTTIVVMVSCAAIALFLIVGLVLVIIRSRMKGRELSNDSNASPTITTDSCCDSGTTIAGATNTDLTLTETTMEASWVSPPFSFGQRSDLMVTLV